MESLEQSIYWFMFVLGLGSLSGFAIIAFKLTQATPNQLKLLTTRIEELLNEQEADSKARDGLLATVQGSIDQCHKMLERLEYQHEHADQFGFGTKEVKSQLSAIHDNLLRITIELDRKGGNNG